VAFARLDSVAAAPGTSKVAAKIAGKLPQACLVCHLPCLHSFEAIQELRIERRTDEAA
jgi:hypothetical protein